MNLLDDVYFAARELYHEGKFVADWLPLSYPVTNIVSRPVASIEEFAERVDCSKPFMSLVEEACGFDANGPIHLKEDGHFLLKALCLEATPLDYTQIITRTFKGSRVGDKFYNALGIAEDCKSRLIMPVVCNPPKVAMPIGIAGEDANTEVSVLKEVTMEYYREKVRDYHYQHWDKTMGVAMTEDEMIFFGMSGVMAHLILVRMVG